MAQKPHGKGQLTNKGGAVAVGVWIDGKRQTHWFKEPAMRLWSRLTAGTLHAFRPARAPHDDRTCCKKLDRAVRSVLSWFELMILLKTAQHGASRASPPSRKRFLTHARHQ